MRIPTLLQKIRELAEQSERPGVIDVDLMLDYTRVLYADLLEWRAKLATPPAAPAAVVMPPIYEPTLSEMADAMDEDEDDDTSETANGPQPEFPATLKNTQVATSEFVQPAPATSNHIQSATRDIRSLISINEKYQIMSELFGNDKAAYEDALNHVNAADDEHEAVKWLQDRLWVTEERSDAALSFYDLVRRFKNQ